MPCTCKFAMSAIPPLAIEQRTFKSRRSGPRSDIAYGSDPGFDFRGCCHAGAPAAENSDRTGPCLPLADSTMRGLAAWTFRPVHEEVFKDETAFAALKWSAATPAGNLAIYRHRSRFGTNNLILGAAAWAVEGCYRRVGRHGEKGHTPAMPRKKQKLIVAAHRVAEARRIIANLDDRIVTLKTLGRPTPKMSERLKRVSVRLSTLRITSRELKSRTKPRNTKPKKETDASELEHQLQKVRAVSV